MKKARMFLEVLIMFTVGVMWYMYINIETVIYNWRVERRRRQRPL